MFSDSRVPRLAAHQFLSAHEENMDNSTYVPNHLPPPSLVVFSQAGGLPEALRMQRPFNPQVTDSKDLQVPFSTAASLGYGLHHMLHLPPQFLHPLDHRLPFGGFRPLVPSAFAPPSKCLKVETGNGAVPGNGGLPSIGSLSSMSNMFSPTSLPGAGGGAVVYTTDDSKQSSRKDLSVKREGDSSEEERTKPEWSQGKEKERRIEKKRVWLQAARHLSSPF
ncbi:PREDICTED: uncharacterized protein LOC108754922 [Trachymyrmex septentrionalis]|uniref:uncharacterized protein LOC108754922 n=1 Tax=Trachymyrmex septentrionalis TaxID=34720 RepID=UPI00084F7446|nr:PREDICTED: uncharacterized protein LOC108754922 [Trachymyrmex septentrionalis]